MPRVRGHASCTRYQVCRRFLLLSVVCNAPEKTISAARAKTRALRRVKVPEGGWVGGWDNKLCAGYNTSLRSKKTTSTHVSARRVKISVRSFAPLDIPIHATHSRSVCSLTSRSFVMRESFQALYFPGFCCSVYLHVIPHVYTCSKLTMLCLLIALFIH